MTVDYAALFQAVVPETILVVTALIVLGLDLLALRSRTVRNRTRVLGGVTAAGCGAALWWMLNRGTPVVLLNGMFVSD